MKDKVAEAWRRETRAAGRNPILVENFANRLEEELRSTISKETAIDQVVDRTLKRFQNEQKNF
jgi:hypothetical protein